MKVVCVFREILDAVMSGCHAVQPEEVRLARPYAIGIFDISRPQEHMHDDESFENDLQVRE